MASEAKLLGSARIRIQNDKDIMAKFYDDGKCVTEDGRTFKLPPDKLAKYREQLEKANSERRVATQKSVEVARPAEPKQPAKKEEPVQNRVPVPAPPPRPVQAQETLRPADNQDQKDGGRRRNRNRGRNRQEVPVEEKQATHVNPLIPQAPRPKVEPDDEYEQEMDSTPVEKETPPKREPVQKPERRAEAPKPKAEPKPRRVKEPEPEEDEYDEADEIQIVEEESAHTSLMNYSGDAPLFLDQDATQYASAVTAITSYEAVIYLGTKYSRFQHKGAFAYYLVPRNGEKKKIIAECGMTDNEFEYAIYGITLALKDIMRNHIRKVMVVVGDELTQKVLIQNAMNMQYTWDETRMEYVKLMREHSGIEFSPQFAVIDTHSKNPDPYFSVVNAIAKDMVAQK